MHCNDDKWICYLCASDVLPFNHYDDNIDFLNSVSELWNTIDINLPIQNLENICFNPFEINDESGALPLFDIAADINFYNDFTNNTTNSNYFIEDTFMKQYRKHNLTSDQFSLMHLNIRSIPRHLSEFNNYISMLGHSFSIYGFTETWFSTNNVHCYGLDNYAIESNYRNDRSGGGVSLFIKSCIEYTCRTDLDINDKNIESIFVEINKDAFAFSKNVIVGVIYRPPNTNMASFIDKLSSILSKVKEQNKLCYILGDFNINLLNESKHVPTAEFLDLMYSMSYVPLINKPTHISNQSATLIDNIFTNHLNIDSNVWNGILYTDISDHLPIFHFSASKSTHAKNDYVIRRIYSSENSNNFVNLMQGHDWSDLYMLSDPNEAFNVFHKVFINYFNECFPLKYIKIKYSNRKPWLTDAMKTSIKTKNRMYANLKR